MDWVASLEKRFGSWAIPNLTLWLIVLQVCGVILLMGGYVSYVDMILQGDAVLRGGKWWQLLSFMMMPKTLSPLWLIFAFYIFYLMGSALEHQWGAFRYNLFILCGYLLTVAVAFIAPGAYITNFFFLGCVFLAFATLFPNFEFYIFFILPMKVKWLGWVTVAAYVWILLTGDAGSRLCVGAAFVNYAIFFGREFMHNMAAGQRRKAYQARTAALEGQPRHECAACGITDKTDPSMHFRYCSTCGKCFCEAHISQHEH